MNVFEDLLGELKEERLLEETVIKLPASENGAAAGRVLRDETEVDDFIDTDGRDHREITSAEESEGDEYFQKRATEEVAAMQLVEHVLAGIEREHLGTRPSTYDDLEAKKALHRFVHVAAEPGSPEYEEAESAMLTETHAWSAALYRRDETVSLATMRTFCENCRPVLSSQALLALSRFYRNGPPSEPTRQKFEFVMTRLFSREVNDYKRKLLFDRKEMIRHIRNLYGKWASLSLVDAGDEETAIESIVRSFGDCVQRARAADGLDEMIEDGLIEHLNALKGSTNELFFEPEVVAAAIECNVRVANRTLEVGIRTSGPALLEASDADSEADLSESISVAVGRTLGLREIDRFAAVSDVEESEQMPRPAPVYRSVEVSEKAASGGYMRANKWLVMTTILALAVSSGIYLWADRAATPDSSASRANMVDLAGTDVAAYLRTGRSTDTTFYAITLPTWDSLSEQQKKDVVQKSVALAEKMKLKRVELLNYKGRTVAFGSSEKIELLEQ